jgi:hypothetical protein
MTFQRFELSVMQLASRGVRLTVANVSAQIGVEPQQAEAWLDDMARQGRLDVELDEDVGLIFYRVRGLSPPPAYLATAPHRNAPQPLQTQTDKNPRVAALLGLLLPGAGLIYAAPLSVAVFGGLLTLVLVNTAAAVPLLGGIASSVVLGLCALTSSLFAVMYTRRYNEHGRRTHLVAGTPRRIASAAAQSAAGWTQL